jgi:hypothetical protein
MTGKIDLGKLMGMTAFGASMLFVLAIIAL